MKTTKLVVGRKSLMIAFYRGGKKKDPELGTNFFLGIEYNCHGICTFL
jgi:hypothetical protein